MEQSTRATGKMTSKTDGELKPGRTGLNTKETTKRERSMATEPIFGLMVLNMLVNGTKTKSTERESTHGWTAESTKEVGKTTTCMAWELTPGKTAENTRENTILTRSTGMESTSGKMAADTRGTGRMGSNTERASTFFQMEQLRLAFGMKVSE